MASLKELKNRIASVKSTQKITKAMKMVAASKVKKAYSAFEYSKNYLLQLRYMIQVLINDNKDDERILLNGNGRSDRYLLLIVGTDRGLCGGINSAVVRLLKEKISDLNSQNKEFKIITIGTKVHDLLLRVCQSELIYHYSKLSNFADIEVVSNQLLKLFNASFDVVLLFYTSFISMMSQEACYKRLLPFDFSSNVKNIDPSLDGGEYDFSNASALLDSLLPCYLKAQFYELLLESYASEEASRVASMDNASRNASDMIAKLTLNYNRTRQAVITNELIEIISGAEAV